MDQSAIKRKNYRGSGCWSKPPYLLVWLVSHCYSSHPDQREMMLVIEYVQMAEFLVETAGMQQKKIDACFPPLLIVAAPTFY